MRTAALAAGLHLVASLLPAQAPITEPGTEQFTVTARSNGVAYRVDAWLPPGLDTMSVRPPVFVVTDGNLAFHTVHQTVAMLMISGEVTPMIVVGVSYPQEDGRGYTPSYIVNRTRDYTPTSIESMPGGGGSAAFAAFLKGELLPMVESRWRADPSRRGLGGHSLGGLFATYVLLNHPGLFTRYWIGSPSLWWDAPLPFTWVTAAKAGGATLSGRAFLTVGGDEGDVMVPPMRRMSAELKRTFPALQVGSQVFPNESHGSVVAGAISRSLRFLYGDLGRPTVALSPTARAAYAGDWSNGALTIHLRPAAEGVALSFDMMGNTMKEVLRAASRDTLFSHATMTTQWVAVRDAQGRIAALRGTLLGATSDYSRVERKE